MKKTLNPMLVVVSAAIAFSSCSKSVSTTKPTSATQKNMSAKIDGIAFSRDTCRCYWADSLDSSKVIIYDWSSFPPSGPDYHPLIEMSLQDYHGIGTYSLVSGKNFAELLTDKSTGGVNSYASGGAISITSIYPNMVGTFHFATAGGIEVTNGTFTARRN